MNIPPLLSAVDLYLREAAEVHALCDRLLIPRKVDGAVLSMAQRVNTMACVLESTLKMAGRGISLPTQQ